MAHAGVTDVYLENIEATFRGKTYFLQTSPEYHMKRLLAAGSGPIFQLSRAFRDDELGRWHNPEFTMLEWYKLGSDYHQLIHEIDGFLQAILQTPPMRKITYQQLFFDVLGLDPINAPLVVMKQALVNHQLGAVLDDDEQDREQYLFLLMSHVIEPKLASYAEPIVIYDYPASQAALAQIKGDVAERFEVFYRGVELANGFHELSDVDEQRMRFEQDNQKRQSMGLSKKPIDKYLLQALEHGLPDCSGVALGIDRLISLALGQESLSTVLAFDFANS